MLNLRANNALRHVHKGALLLKTVPEFGQLNVSFDVALNTQDYHI
jgi:hypothetical protein